MGHACAPRLKCKESMLNTGRLLSSHYPGPGDSKVPRQSRQVHEQFRLPSEQGGITDQGLNSEEVSVLDTVSGARRASESTSHRNERKEKTAAAFARLYAFMATHASRELRRLSCLPPAHARPELLHKVCSGPGKA